MIYIQCEKSSLDVDDCYERRIVFRLIDSIYLNVIGAITQAVSLRDKENPPSRSAFLESLWWVLKVYGSMIIFEIFLALK